MTTRPLSHLRTWRRMEIETGLTHDRNDHHTGGAAMTAVYTWDVFATLDCYGAYAAKGIEWGGYSSKQGPELLEHRAALFDTEQRMVFGATTFRENAEIMTSGADPHTLHE